ncbi:LOW QUALITY PROTEIN: hypothetical protein YC2023_102173 [Brassica napus]
MAEERRRLRRGQGEEEEVELDSKNQSGFDAAVEGHCWELIRTLTRLVVTETPLVNMSSLMAAA